MKLIAPVLTAVLALSVAGIASAEPRDMREQRSQPTREVRERPVKERTVVERDTSEQRQAREVSATRDNRSSILRQGKQLINKVCKSTPQDCH